MSRQSPDGFATREPRENVERRLRRLGPVIRRQEAAEAELDQEFAASLRQTLLARVDSSRSAAAASAAPKESHRRHDGGPLVILRRPSSWIALAAAAVTALVIVSSVLFARKNDSILASVPVPTRSDLLLNFPSDATILHVQLGPLVSLIHPRNALPFAGHISFHGQTFSNRGGSLKVYRLAAPHLPNGTLHRLGIPDSFHRQKTSKGEWMVAAHGGHGRVPLHSLALSLTSGEVIYHDQRNRRLPHAAHPLRKALAVSVARSWLTKLGWPGQAMPVHQSGVVRGQPLVRQVEFGWVGVRDSATQSATLWLAPDRSVIEAWIWPAVQRSTTTSSRGASVAWSDVDSRRVPVAIQGIPSRSSAIAKARVGLVSIVDLLVPTRHSLGYLVPAYRFGGIAHVIGKGTHSWFALAPAAR